MYEIVAILAGVTIGLIALSVISIPLRVLMLGAGSAVVGAVVSVISGEVSLNPVFLVFDTIQVLIAAVVAMAIVSLWRRQRSST